MQKTVAEAAGIDKSFLSRELRGLEPASLEMIRRVSRALELPDDYFVEVQRAEIVRHLESSVEATRELYVTLAGSRTARRTS